MVTYGEMQILIGVFAKAYQIEIHYYNTNSSFGNGFN
jgi:hypothetical protein